MCRSLLWISVILPIPRNVHCTISGNIFSSCKLTIIIGIYKRNLPKIQIYLNWNFSSQLQVIKEHIDNWIMLYNYSFENNALLFLNNPFISILEVHFFVFYYLHFTSRQLWRFFNFGKLTVHSRSLTKLNASICISKFTLLQGNMLCSSIYCHKIVLYFGWLLFSFCSVVMKQRDSRINFPSILPICFLEECLKATSLTQMWV